MMKGMKNVLANSPTMAIHGRGRRNMTYVSTEDLAGKRVLDVGCGYGWFERFALQNGAAAITGLEVQEEDLAAARAFFAKDARVTLVTGSATDLPLSDELFDTVVCWEVLEHIPPRTEQRLFDEAFRVLTPGGVFYLSTPYASWRAKLTDPAWWLIGHRHYTQRQLATYARHAGFVLEDVEHGGGWGAVLHMLNLLIAKWVFRRGPFFQAFFDQWRDREYGTGTGFGTIFITCRKPL